MEIKLDHSKGNLKEVFGIDGDDILTKPFNELSNQEKGYLVALGLSLGEDYLKQISIEVGCTKENIKLLFVELNAVFNSAPTFSEAAAGVINRLSDEDIDRIVCIARVNLRTKISLT